jgi:hypothetical protein
MRSRFVRVVTAAVLALPFAALAHDTADHAKRPSISTEEHPASKATRARRAHHTLTADDTMRYSRSQIRVARGNDHLVVTNKETSA